MHIYIFDNTFYTKNSSFINIFLLILVKCKTILNRFSVIWYYCYFKRKVY